MLRRELIGKVAGISAAAACAPILASNKPAAPHTVLDALSDNYLIDITNRTRSLMSQFTTAYRTAYRIAAKRGLVTEIPQEIAVAARELGFDLFLKSTLIRPFSVTAQGITWKRPGQEPAIQHLSEPCKYVYCLGAVTESECTMLMNSPSEMDLPDAYETFLSIFASSAGRQFIELLANKDYIVDVENHNCYMMHASNAEKYQEDVKRGRIEAIPRQVVTAVRDLGFDVYPWSSTCLVAFNRSAHSVQISCRHHHEKIQHLQGACQTLINVLAVITGKPVPSVYLASLSGEAV